MGRAVGRFVLDFFIQPSGKRRRENSSALNKFNTVAVREAPARKFKAP
jgi:hypothetical protein